MKNDYQVGIYLRLSKEDDRLGESGSITNQRAILMNYIKENKLTYVKEYIDDGVSGTTFNRTGFNQMIQDIENKKINMILTKDTSRLGRDHIEFGYYVEKYFPEHNVRYVAVCDNIDTIYNNNDMLLFKSAYNDMYVKDISNKIRASLNIKKRNGEFVGAYAPYGYVKDPNDKHRLLIDEEAAFVVRRIFKLFIQGVSITKIADILTEEQVVIPSIYKNMNRGIKSSLFGIWTTRTITDILTNPTYMGDLTQGRSRKINYKSKKRIHTKKKDWIVVKGSCPVIVEANVFELAQKMYQLNKNKFSNIVTCQDDLLLKGLIYCEECGHTIGFRTVFQKTKKAGNSKKIYGNCNYYLKKRKYHACTPHSIRYQELENLILEKVLFLSQLIDKKKLKYNILKEGLRTSSLGELKQKESHLKKEIELEKRKLDPLYEDKLSGFINKEQYLKVLKKIEGRIQNLQLQLIEIVQKIEKLEATDCQENFETIYSHFIKSRVFIAGLIEKITISEEGKIHIYFRINNETLEGISCNTIPK